MGSQMMILLYAITPIARYCESDNNSVKSIPMVSLRFKCLCYLADECGEDVTKYC